MGETEAQNWYEVAEMYAKLGEDRAAKDALRRAKAADVLAEVTTKGAGEYVNR